MMQMKEIIKMSRRAKIAIPKSPITIKNELVRISFLLPYFSTKKIEMKVKRNPANP